MEIVPEDFFVTEDETEDRLTYVMKALEDKGFSDNIDWDTNIAPGVTVEELVGAVVSAHYTLTHR